MALREVALELVAGSSSPLLGRPLAGSEAPRGDGALAEVFEEALSVDEVGLDEDPALVCVAVLFTGTTLFSGEAIFLGAEFVAEERFGAEGGAAAFELASDAAGARGDGCADRASGGFGSALFTKGG